MCGRRFRLGESHAEYDVDDERRRDQKEGVRRAVEGRQTAHGAPWKGPKNAPTRKGRHGSWWTIWSLDPQNFKTSNWKECCSSQLALIEERPSGRAETVVRRYPLGDKFLMWVFWEYGAATASSSLEQSIFPTSLPPPPSVCPRPTSPRARALQHFNLMGMTRTSTLSASGRQVLLLLFRARHSREISTLQYAPHYTGSHAPDSVPGQRTWRRTSSSR